MQDGRVFTCGVGELGRGGYERVAVPQEVTWPHSSHVVGVAAGDGHTLMWTYTGDVFTFGSPFRSDSGRLSPSGTEHGQLGHGPGGLIEHYPRLVEALAGARIMGATVGASHTVVWTHIGDVYSFGCNNYGQLGCGWPTGEAGEVRVEFTPRRL